MKKRVILIVLAIILIIASLLIGASDKVTIIKLFQLDKEAWQVFLVSRGPRTLAIILTASGLSVAGLVMQSISRNKFISPSTAGTTDAAMLGVLISYLILGNQNRGIKMLFAFTFALLSTFLFMFLLKKTKFKDVVYVPLIGMMYGGIIFAICSFIAQSFDASDILASLSNGSFSNITEKNMSLLFLIIPPIIFVFIYATKFSIVSAGEDFAKNLGVNYNKVMIIGLVIVALISASSFLIVGPLPFVGLIIPNLVSYYYGDNLKKSVVDIALFGTIFVLINDIIARTIIFPYEVSISLVMGIVGAVIFMVMIFRRKKNES